MAVVASCDPEMQDSTLVVCASKEGFSLWVWQKRGLELGRRVTNLRRGWGGKGECAAIYANTLIARALQKRV